MTKAIQKTELVANILIIALTLLIGGVVVQKYLLSPNTVAKHQRVEPKIGSVVQVPNIEWSQQPKTLVLALQAGCRFCNESTTFYKRVIEAVKGRNVKLVAVFPTDVEESAAHLNKLGLNDMEVKQSSLGSLQVSGTPTLILTNEKGEVTNYWVGKLTPDKETEVINKFNS